MEISIITPLYGCRDCIYEFYYRVSRTLEEIGVSFEIIFVNDNSPDKPWSLLEELAKKDDRLKAIDLSRNFGQHYAITAGLCHAKGKWVVVMDCDLQDQPEEIKKLYAEAQKGYDIVLAQRALRKDGFFKRIFSKGFYWVLGYLTDTKQDPSVANFGIYNKRVVEAILQMKDTIRYLPTMVQWVGFNKTAISVNHAERFSGETTYNIKKLINLGTNVVLSFSEKPLLLVIRFGIFISVLSFCAGLVFLIKYYLGQISVLGFTSLLLSIWFLSGIIIFILGIIGLYIGKTFDKVKDRPIYLVRDKLNF